MQTYRSKFKKILVTGGSGLVGRALASIQDTYNGREFLFISSKDCNLLKSSSVVAFVKKHKPDAIIHLAAVSGGIGFSMRCPATLLRDNVLMDINILEAARKNNVKKIVMTLSSGMYPENAPNPLREDSIHQGYPHGSNYSYSFAKRLVDPLVKSYRTEYGMAVIGLIPNGILGENSNYKKDESTMVPSLIRRFYENKNTTEDIVIWGDGSPLRELTYAGDIARAYMWCLDGYDSEQVLNIGTTEEVSVKEVAYMIADSLGVDKKRIVFDTAKPSGQHRKNTDNSRFMSLSHFRYTPCKKSVAYTLAYFQDNYGKKGRLRI